MTAAIIGLTGAIFGAITALVGSSLSDRRQVRVERVRWRRDQLSSAYEQALRYLLRGANRRSEFEGGRGGAILRPEHQREWFDDLVEAQVSLRPYCDIAALPRQEEFNGQRRISIHTSTASSPESVSIRKISLFGESLRVALRPRPSESFGWYRRACQNERRTFRPEELGLPHSIQQRTADMYQPLASSEDGRSLTCVPW